MFSLSNIKFSFLFLVIASLFLTCRGEDEFPTMPGVPGDSEESGLPTIVPSGEEQYLQLESDYIFDQSALHTYELIIPEESLAFLDADPAKEEYVEGMLIFQGDTISPVGVRYKGSVGGFVGCVDGSDWFNPSGKKTCTKLSMKVKVNWKDREERFFKLNKLQFHSQNLDDSKMRERLGYLLFREMGVRAPRSVHARLMINGTYSGLYALTEQIDGRFVKYNYDDDDGNLYKEVWPLNSNGQPHSEATYLAGLKTNEDDNPTATIIKNFAQKIADASDAELQDKIAESMDIDEIISYAVVDRTIKHDDGPFHWYCNFFGDCESHNFYWYEEPNSGQLHLLPWDLDNAFENIIQPSNPVTPIPDAWGETRNDCEPFGHGALFLTQRSAACDKLTAGWTMFETEFAAKKLEFKEGPFSETNVLQLLTAWETQIRPAVEEAESLYSDATSVAQWESAIQELKNQLEFARSQ